MNIAFMGLIGAGKSTIAQSLSKHYKKRKLYLENVESRYMKDFYKDKKKYAFQTEMNLLYERYMVLKSIERKGKETIQDRSIYEDLAFANVLKKNKDLTDRDYKTYLEYFNLFIKMISVPTIIVYLEVKPETAYKRVKKRDRIMERTMPLSYLQDLYEAYKNLIIYIKKIVPVITISWDKDLTADEIEKESIKKIIDVLDKEISQGFYKEIKINL